jgi:hypothetical protein
MPRTPIILAVLMFTLGACGSGAQEESSAGPGRQDPPAAPAKGAAPTGPAGRGGASGAQTAQTAQIRPPGSRPVPRLVGLRLERAENLLAAAGFDEVVRRDATGRERPVLRARNWVVREQSPPAGDYARPTAAIVLKVARPTDPAPTKPPAGVIPKVVCLDLQRAQDSMQAAGYLNLLSRDGTGRGRSQLLDRNWVVTAQAPAPGARPALTSRVMLTAVKYGEPTGRSGCRS